MIINNSDPTFKAHLATRFNKLNRELLVADTADLWRPAIENMTAMLDEVRALLRQEPGLVGENLCLSSRIFSLLLTVAATGSQGRLELYKGKDEKGRLYQAEIESDYIPRSGDLRRLAIEISKEYLENAVFDSLRDAITFEIFPLLDSLNDKVDPDRYMPYRVIQIGNIFERMYAFRLRTADPVLLGLAGRKGLLREIYDRKYLRFGTSGRCSLGLRWFCRRRLYTFSTSIMASSTNEPMAIHIPPRVMVLMFMPNR